MFYQERFQTSWKNSFFKEVYIFLLLLENKEFLIIFLFNEYNNYILFGIKSKDKGYPVYLVCFTLFGLRRAKHTFI
jgi:hypothetical protein